MGEECGTRVFVTAIREAALTLARHCLHPFCADLTSDYITLVLTSLLCLRHCCAYITLVSMLVLHHVASYKQWTGMVCDRLRQSRREGEGAEGESNSQGLSDS